ncbi:MAG: hypothetical protein ABI844_08205 [Saprospiraceae bacterium]
MYNQHNIYAESNFGIFDFFIDGNDAAHKIKDPTVVAQRFAPSGINLNPVGSGNNYISFPMLADIGFKVTVGQAWFSDVQLRNFREPSNILFAEL